MTSTPPALVARISAPRKRSAVVLLSLMMLASLATFGIRRGHVGDCMDDGLYFVSAQALRDGKGYTLPSQVGPPIRSRYSIGLPAALAAALRLSPLSPSLEHDFLVVRSVILISGWCLMLGIFVWLRRIGVGPLPAALIAAMTLFQPTTMNLLISAMSDIPFAALSFALLIRWAGRGHRSRGPAWDFANGLLSGASMVVRGNGITLLLGSLVASIRRSPRASALNLAACLVGAAAVIAAAQYATKLHTGTHVAGGYRQELVAGWHSAQAARKVIVANVVGLAESVPSIIFPLLGTRAFSSKTVARPIEIAIWAVFLVGVARLIRDSRRRDRPVWVHVGGTLAIFMIWPWPLSPRFILCLIPMVLLAFGHGADVILERVRAGRPGMTLALGLAMAGSLMTAGWVSLNAYRHGGVWADLADMASFDKTLDQVRSRLPGDAVVVSMMPELVYLYTNRQGMLLFLEEDKLRGDYGRRDRILARMAEVPGRPFFLLGPPPGATDPVARQDDAFAQDPALVVREIYRTDDNRYWLASVEPAAPRD